jgi:hypothetical protein
MQKWILLAGLGLIACSNGQSKDDDDDSPPIPDGPGDKGCGETNPVINGFSITDAGMREYDSGLHPSIALTVDISDDDGDLHYYEYRAWWDDVVDGVVSTEGFYSETYGTVDNDECKVFSVSLTMYLGITGGDKSPAFDTEQEFGVVVRDDKGHESGDGSPTIQVFTTPDSEGNY